MEQVEPRALRARLVWPDTSLYIMTALLLVLGFYIVYPVLLITINSFNVAGIGAASRFGVENWRVAFQEPGVLGALGNTLLLFALYTSVSFPVAVFIAWTLARVRLPFSYGLEFMFWVAFMIPPISSTIGWMGLLDPDLGFINIGIQRLFPSIVEGPFNVFSVPGIMWAHLMTRAISSKVMLLTPAFRNMDSAMEEASRVSGASTLKTMIKVTLPVMVPAMVVVFALNMVRLFESFEIEQLLGVPFRFFVYSTKILDLVQSEPPAYGQATALASLTLGVIAFIIPLQRRLTERRQFTTVTSKFKPGLINIGTWRFVVFGLIVLLLVLLIAAPVFSLVLGSFMTRSGYFEVTPVLTLQHWKTVLADNLFAEAFRNTFLLAGTTAILSPLLFSMIAYVLVRTRWAGRSLLDSMIWFSAVIPGMLSGLGLLWMFLDTPFLKPLYGTLWPLVLVVILQGKLTGVQLSKAVFLQVGEEMEEASLLCGAGWLRTYFRVWLPLIMPTMVLLGTFHFVLAASTTSSIILLATRGTMTLSILALEYASPGVALREEAGIVSLFIVGLTVGVALIARALGLRLGVQHN